MATISDVGAGVGVGVGAGMGSLFPRTKGEASGSR